MRRKSILHLVPENQLKTIEDFMALDDDGRTELLDGVFVVSPSPILLHQAAIAQLVFILSRQVNPRKLGRVFGSPLDTVLSRTTVVHPDVLFLSTAKLRLIKKLVEGPPDLAVEFLSPSNPEHDLEIKMGLYLKFGVTEYWIGDIEARTIRVLENAGARWIERGTFGTGAVISPICPPGVLVAVDEVYEFPE